jgi:hypothetical protein
LTVCSLVFCCTDKAKFTFVFVLLPPPAFMPSSYYANYLLFDAGAAAGHCKSADSQIFGHFPEKKPSDNIACLYSDRGSPLQQA